MDVSEVEATQLIDAAIDLARDAAAGKIKTKPMSKDPMETTKTPPEVNIGHLSKATDRIICRAILEGCRKPLEEGLKFESQMFGECVTTDDMKTGIDNFIKNGPRAKALFMHA